MVVSAELQNKYTRLQEILHSLKGVVVAFSGGIDSTLLAVIAFEELGSGMLAVTALSPTYPQSDLEQTKLITSMLSMPHEFVNTNEFEDPEFRTNPPHRCYICKQYLFEKLKEVAKERGFSFVVEGSNADDMSDYRPGMRAVKELEIRSPLLEAGFTKNDIRALAKEKNVKIWDIPASACLSSRIPYNEEITLERLKRVESAEIILKKNEFNIVRVRDFNSMAIVELGDMEIRRIGDNELRQKIVSEIKNAGYERVVLDLQGYRTGSMNEQLDLNRKKQE